MCVCVCTRKLVTAPPTSDEKALQADLGSDLPQAAAGSYLLVGLQTSLGHHFCFVLFLFVFVSFRFFSFCFIFVPACYEYTTLDLH